mmetsp:Transcript_5515/g.17750  ORF Transcript_5515/g.17750 Transcript_5515/m.17750 type:complete len:89 (+) Transcript_5515:99-365(+)
MPRRGPGSKCSPASSPALSYSTGLRLGPSWGSLVDLVLPSPAVCAAALIVLALYFLVAATRVRHSWLAFYEPVPARCRRRSAIRGRVP